MIIYCLSNSLVANNTLSGFDQDIISVTHVTGYVFGGSVDGLKLRNNILVSNGKPL